MIAMVGRAEGLFIIGVLVAIGFVIVGLVQWAHERGYQQQPPPPAVHPVRPVRALRCNNAPTQKLRKGDHQ